MSQAQIGNVLLCYTAAVAVLSVVLHLLTPWWRSEMGRHLTIKAAVFALVLVLGVVRVIIGDSPVFQILRTCVFALVPVVLTWRVWLQLKARRLNQQQEKRLRPVRRPRSDGGSL
jgi:hypothetical protein